MRSGDKATGQLPRWVRNPTIRSTFSLPPTGAKAARVVAIIRALLLNEDVPAAWHEYQALLARTEGVIDRGKVDILEPGFVALPEDEEAIWEFCGKYLYGSQFGQLCLKTLLALDALHFDPLGFDSYRAEKSETWGIVYGPQPSTRPGRRELRQQRKALKQQLNSLQWEHINDRTLMERANMWVNAHIVWENLTVAVKKHYENKPIENHPTIDNLIGLYKWWDKILKPFDDAVERVREKGKRLGV